MEIVGDGFETGSVYTPRGESNLSSLTFDRQPAIPDEFGPPDFSNRCDNGELNPGRVDVLLPSAGVNEETGLVVGIGGIANNCPDGGAWFYHDQETADRFNLVLSTVWVRNLERLPVDYGRYKVVDAMRGIGAVLEEYPEIDRQRIHLYGASGGGMVVMQMHNLIPGWASASAQSGLTLLSTREETQDLYEQDPGSGWGMVNGWFSRDGQVPAQRFFQSPLRNIDSIWFNGNKFNAFEGDTFFYSEHGTADDLVDFQHFLDFRAKTAEMAGVGEDWPLVFESGGYRDLWGGGNYWFIALNGEDHVFNRTQSLGFVENQTGRHPFDQIHPDGIAEHFETEIRGHGYKLTISTSEAGLLNTMTLPIVGTKGDGMIFY